VSYNIGKELRLQGVQKVTTRSGIYYQAKPLKALCDYVCLLNCDWKGVNAVNDYLRVKYYKMEELTKEDFDEIQGSYKVKNVENFIESMRKDLRV
jgi:hypothetical protein